MAPRATHELVVAYRPDWIALAASAAASPFTTVTGNLVLHLRGVDHDAAIELRATFATSELAACAAATPRELSSLCAASLCALL